MVSQLLKMSGTGFFLQSPPTFKSLSWWGKRLDFAFNRKENNEQKRRSVRLPLQSATPPH